jgi:glycerate-2-kinase
MPIILNKEKLIGAEGLSASERKLRREGLEILEAGLSAIDTKSILSKKVRMEGGMLCVDDKSFACSSYERIFFIGIGKCAFDGAETIEEIIGDKLTSGIVVDVKSGILKRIDSYKGTHPYPSEINVGITREILQMIKGVTERDLVLVLVSGGGSSLFSMPKNVNAEELVRITKALTEAGADIYELNTVRKHLSEVLGGGLARLCFPAEVVSLIFSDVLGNDLSMVASGPTVLDTTSVDDAKNILRKYSICEKVGMSCVDLVETPKDQKYFERVKNVLVVSNRTALDAMKTKAENLGYSASIETEMLKGEARVVGENLASTEILGNTCLLFGGETTVSIKGDGDGGRNQELALSALLSVRDHTILISSSSDGWDNTEFAGALADRALRTKSEQMGLEIGDYLERNDSFNYFEKVCGGIYTGRLGSNVSDLVIMLNNK